MKINDPGSRISPRFVQAGQLMLAALAAVVIAVASQGSPEPEPLCEGGACVPSPSTGVGEGG